MRSKWKLTLASILVICMLPGCLEVSQQQESRQEPTGIKQPTHCGLPKEGKTKLTFQEFMKQMREDPAIRSIEGSPQNGKYAYIKETGPESFEVYYGKYPEKKEELIIRHRYSAADSVVSLSPNGKYVLVTQLVGKKKELYSSEFFQTTPMKGLFKMNSYGPPIWDSDSSLIHSGEYFEKYPSRYRGIIWVMKLKGDDVSYESERIVEGPENRTLSDVFYIEKIVDNTVHYKQVHLKTGKTKNGSAKYTR